MSTIFNMKTYYTITSNILKINKNNLPHISQNDPLHALQTGTAYSVIVVADLGKSHIASSSKGSICT